ncbi:kinase-like protein [Aspergillus ellipticus CBS 707.79]|uniref:Kinase-like protein n=1 Tax=Aspergillus ellipticus CBS 707.79 TaxID=1448320 RepID=A0A319D0L0_9EURO|nr:kinase-like protein [Aspergillus ellipticus CBS 707.79]
MAATKWHISEDVTRNLGCDTGFGNQLRFEGPPWGLEKRWAYEAGGHHPVHLGDCFGEEDQYRVIHKLGSGGFANIWLCRVMNGELPQYVALKILMADYSKDDSPELRVNQLRDISHHNPIIRDHGSNGAHLCFVYPVAGPRVSCMVKERNGLDKTLRKIAHQVAKAMAALHHHEICHGDFMPAYILLHTEGVNDLSEEDLIKTLGEPRTTNVITSADEPSTEPTAPRYAVYPIEFNKADSRFLTLDKKVGVGCDLWALGCTRFQIRTGRKFFDMYDDEDDSQLFELVLLLGSLPEPWWSTTWETRRQYFEDKPDSCGRAVRKFTIDGESVVARSLVEALQGSMLYYKSEDERWKENVYDEIPDAEVMVFTDLLQKLLQWDPEKRLPADKVVEHPWFDL